MNVYCGCSGYQYDDWRGDFYPESFPREQWFEYYCQGFNSVEINNSFYQLPTEETTRHWKEVSPDDFRFSIKGSRYITHMKKLKWDDDLEEAVERFYQSIAPLSEQISCVLWQLPGNLKAHPEKLTDFFPLLKNDYTNVFEFREASWFTDEILEILSDNNALCCSLSSPDAEYTDQLYTQSQKAYIRFHGLEEWYKDKYSKKELQAWIDKIEEADPEEVYIYFNNTANAYAIENSMQMMEMLQEYVV